MTMRSRRDVERRLPRHVERREHRVVRTAGREEVGRLDAHELEQQRPGHEHALRRTRGAGRVDHRAQVEVVGPRLVGDRHRAVEELGGTDETDRAIGQVVGVGDDHGLEAGEARGDLDEPVEVPLRDDRVARTRVGDQVPQHLAEVHVVRRHLDRAQPRDAEPHEVRLERVRHHRDDVLAGSDPDVAKRAGPAPQLAVELAVGHRAALDVFHRHAVGRLARPLGDHVREDELAVEHQSALLTNACS